MLALDGVFGCLTILAIAVAFDAERERQIEDDGGREHVPTASQLDERRPILRLDVGGVDHGQAAQLEALVDDRVEQFEGGGGDRLVGVVVADERPAAIARHNLGFCEMPPSKRRLARARCATEHHEAEFGDLDAGQGGSHRRKIAICVGDPQAGSRGPMPLISKL